LLDGSEHEPPVIGSTNFEAEATQLGTKPSAQQVDVSSPEVGANVGVILKSVIKRIEIISMGCGLY
jgi:hypothetical protein